MRLLLILCALLANMDCCFAKVRIGVAPSIVDVDDSNQHYLLYVRYMTVPFASQRGAIWTAGNDTTGKTIAQIQAIVNAIKNLETDALQKEIYTKMKACTTEIFAFRNVAQAKSVVLQRLETIRMMKAFNQDSRYTYHSAANPASTTAAAWDKGSRVKFYFRQKTGTATAAITEICSPSTKTYGECLGGIMACVWWGASQGMGQNAFDALYVTSALNMDYKNPPGNGSWRKNTTDAAETSVLVPGDWFYFNNYNYNLVIHTQDFYKKGWLNGESIYFWSGENTLYVGGDLNEGLGVVGKTENQLREELQLNYNTALATVIKEVGKLGGTYKGMEIVEITALKAPEKIKIINLKRVSN